MKRVIFGKNDLQRIVSIEPGDEHAEVFTEDEEGNVLSEFVPSAYFMLFPMQHEAGLQRLKGNLLYKYGKKFSTVWEFQQAKQEFRGRDYYTLSNLKENLMVRTGYTYFKGMRHDEPSILAFDIETNGLKLDNDSRVFLISNTFRSKKGIEKKLFAYDEYASPAEMINAWCEWVREKNPSLICGHNISCFDIPYLLHVAELNGTTLALGRDGSDLKQSSYVSRFRKDQSQFIEYQKSKIYGREIVDTLFLAIRYDTATKKYENHRLKNIIHQEGLEREGREFYDASQIRFKYQDPEEWKKIKAYCRDDADDSLALYDLMIPPIFYFTQSIPKPLQLMVESATGSQLNALLVRSYLQEGHSIPKADEVQEFEGAISWGNPGKYRNCLKWDVASLYPSVMLQYEIYPRKKDPNKNFLKMLQYFTDQRLENKQKAQETNDIYYKHLEQSQKIGINSAYGMLGANGLNFNAGWEANEVTRKGREILRQAIKWSTGKDYEEWNIEVSDE